MHFFRKLMVLLKKESAGELSAVNLPHDFDPQLYLDLNLDLKEAGVDPVQHYLDHGRHEAWRIYTLPLHELPENFDVEIYLEFNQDVKQDRFAAIAHYLLYGRYEPWRIYFLPDVNVRNYVYDESLDTILIVSHEASRSGAPLLAFNLVNKFVGRYNVLVLLLGDGPLVEDFVATGAAVMLAAHARSNQKYCNSIIVDLCKRFSFKFAIVNSAESRNVLPSLGGQCVATVSLVHEFAACYPNASQIFAEIAHWSNELVFSARLTYDSALVAFPGLNCSSMNILPQGKCLLPVGNLVSPGLDAERAFLIESIRPASMAEDVLVVLGAGYVQLRKGVDLFIETAARVLSSGVGDKFRFVWIGQGFDPVNDGAYSVYLADQIQRSGLQDYVFFLGETPLIDVAYEQADVFLLSSRLDPLPNVAIDAMAYSVPVICFDKATGIADFLHDGGLGSTCVAEYLNASDMAKKIVSLARSRDLLSSVSAHCLSASRVYFNMDAYVENIEVLALSACRRISQ